jgi:hypothetical protein
VTDDLHQAVLSFAEQNSAAVKGELAGLVEELLAGLKHQAQHNAPVSPAIISRAEQILSRVQS